MDAGQQPVAGDTTKLQPPGRPSDTTTGVSAAGRWVWLALGVLLLLALVVMFALPTMVAPVQAPAAEASAEPDPPADNAVERDNAHQTLQSYLQLRARLELEDAPAWGEPDWRAAADQTTAGDRHFAQRQFAAAGRDYQAALDLLRGLETRREELLASALEQAARALAADNVDRAIVSFEAALLIEPGHPAAGQGLVQARNRLASMEQLRRGQTAEAAGQLDAALAAYRQAAQLDSAYVPARDAAQRVAAQINALAFSTAMTRALAAIDAGRLDEAGRALDEAGNLRPDDTAVRDARRRLQGVRALAGLNSLRRQAAAKAGREDWQAAIGLYREALAIDPAAAFAQLGLRHAQERARLHAQFDHYLDKPARLYSAKPLANAEKLLLTASEAPPGEPRLANKITALRDLVTHASTPLTITLKSDGATDVVVYHVGRIGRFESHQLKLLPGDYTIVGSRPGYRDVRKVISLRPGASPQPLLVRCEEAI